MTHDLFLSRDQSRATLLWASPHHMSASCRVLWLYVFWRKKYFVFSLSRDLMWPGGQRDIWHHGCIHLNLPSFMTIGLAKENLLRFYFVMWPHITTRFMWLYRWVPITISHQITMFGGHGTCGREDVKFSICHVNSRDHVIRGLFDIMCEFLSSLVTILPSLVA